MDVRQFAFLARQPSAVVKSRSHFLGLPKRGLALILANAMFWQPLLAQAEGIVVSAPGTTLGQAGNGVPIVNIAAPNGSGLSHNQFQDYNVGANGVILNNATGRTQSTQIGGIIVGNPNFNGNAANVILNEVNGGSPSQLRGYTEVAGQSAHVIVANPYGITCNGCGFINTPQATLTTGKAVIENGQINRYQVDGGSVAIEGAGLNANNIDQFEIITRATTLNAQIQAKKLTIVTGRNDVDARTLNATARASDGSKAPDLAIDSSALGGMYVGAVKLIGTEAGVGVKLSGDMVAGGDIQIDAAGNVVMSQTSAGTAVAVKAVSVEAQGAVYAGTDLSIKTLGALTNQQTLAAKDSITLDAGGRLNNNGIIEAGVNADNSRNTQGDVHLTARAIDNSGKTVIASRDLTINTGELANQGGTLSAQRDAQLTATRVDNQNQGRILSAGNLAINADQLLNSQSGLVASTGNLTVGSGQLINRSGELSSQAQVTLQLVALDNVAGLVSAGQSLSLNASGLINNQGGRIAARQTVQVNSGALDNSQKGSLASQDSLTLNLNQGHWDNRNGQINASGQLTLNNLNTVDNRQGEISSTRSFLLAANLLDNGAGKVLSDQDLTLRIAGAMNNALGLVSASNLDINAANLNNQGGKLSARNLLTANTAGLLDNRGGELLATDLASNTGELNNDRGRLQGDRSLVLNSGVVSNQRGTLAAGKTSILNASRLDNSAGTLTSDGALVAVIAGQLLNQTGLFAAKGDARLNLGRLDNQQGTLVAHNLTVQSSGPLNNQRGTLRGDVAFNLNAGQVDNSEGGRISAGQMLNAGVSGLDQHNDGRFFGQGDVRLNLNNGHLNNQGGTINAPGQLLLSNLVSVDNQGGEISSTQAFTLAADTLNNHHAKLLSEQGLTVRIAQALDNTQGLISAKTLDVRAASLANQGGTLSAGDGLIAQIDGALDNRSGKLLARTASVNSTSLDNREGLLQGDAMLSLNSLGLIDNRQGTLFAGQAMDINATRLDNSGGKLTSDGRLTALISAHLLNQAGLFSATGPLRVSAASLDNSAKGNIHSQAGVDLDLNHGHLNNQGGLIHAPGALLLSNLSSVDNQGGEISSAQALVFTAGSLDNRGGKLLSEQGLLVRVASALDNTKGLVAATGLDLHANSLVNAEGKLKVRDDLTLSVDTALDNSHGEIIGATTILSSMSLDNSQGLLQGDRLLDVTTRGIAINRGGRFVSGQQADLAMGQFDNRGGSVTAAGPMQVSGTQLDNREGGLLNARQSLVMQVDNLNNQGGEVSSLSDLSFHGRQFDNSHRGRLLANGALSLELDQLNNQQGTVRSDTRLTLQTATLNNDGGRLSSGAALNLAASGVMSNRSGELLSAMALTVSSASIDNSGGKMIGDGAVRITTGALNNQSGGRLTSADLLNLTTGQVDNRFDGHIASNKALTASLTGLDQRNGGQLYSTSDLSLDMNLGALNNAGGLIHAPGQLLLRNLASVANQHGEISSERSFVLAAQSLDNSDGNVLSDQALTLKVDQALINLKGVIASAGLTAQAERLDNTSGVFSSSKDLALTLGADLLNDDGEVSSSGATVVNAMTLNNRNDGHVMGDISLDLTTTGALSNQGGTLGAGQRLNVTAASLDNSQSGSLATDGSLTVEVDGLLDNQAKGAVLAKGVMDIQAGSVDNRTGRLSGQDLLTLRSNSLDNRGGAVRANQGLTLRVGQLDNREGVLNSKQALAIAGQSLNNQSGLTSAIGPVRLTLDTVENAKGRIASQDDLDATIGVLKQQGGQWVAQGNLSLNADTLDNQNGGLLAATKVLKLKVGSTDNRSGEISSQQNIEFSGTRLNNSGGKLLAGTGLELAMAEVINQAKGLIFAQDARLTGTAVDNTDGTVGAQRALALQLKAGLDNIGGKLTSEGSMELAGQRIDNTRGKISSAGPLTLASAAALINQGGIVESGQNLTLTSTSLDNTNGLLKSQGLATVSTGLFTNGIDGRVISADKLDLSATQLNNSGHIGSVGAMNASLTGLTQWGGAELISTTQLNLDLHNGELVNAGVINAPLLTLDNLATINNQQGEISSQNAFTLVAKNLDNSNGKLISNQALTLRVDQLLANLKGHINGASLDARSTRLDNTEGLLSGRGDVALSASELFDNQRGSVIADGALLLTSAALDNRNGEIAGKALATINASKLDNQNGKLISTDALNLSGANLDNRNGLVGATKALTLDVATVDNRTGELTSNADVSVTGQRLNNSDKGMVFAGGTLNLAVDQLINRTLGELNGQRLTLTGSMLDNNGGKLLSQESLKLDLAGEFDNSQGVLSSEDALAVKARSLNNSKGSLSSASGLSVAVTDSLNNNEGKLVTDGGLTLQSANLGNQQGIISGKGPVAITTGELNNQTGRLNSGDTLALTTAQLNNGGSIGSAKALTASVTGLDQQGGKLFGNAGLSLDLNNGQLNNQGGLINAIGPLALNNLNRVNNQDGEISSAQAFTLAAQSLDNSNGKLLSNQALTLRVNQALSNLKGLIGGASLDAHAGSVDNRGGTLNSRSDLQLASDGLLSNQDQGLISAKQSLNLNAVSLHTGNGGEVSAKGVLTANLNALALAGGRVVGEQGMTLDLNNSDLDNRNGLLLTNGPLTLKNLRDLNNQGGEISSLQSFALTARNLDNSAGKLISSQVLTVNASTMNNTARGLLSGWQGLNVRGGNLDNRNNGTLSSRSGAIDVRLSGALQNNNEGALVSQGRLGVSAASLDNSGKGVLSSGDGQTLTVAGALTNVDGGLIESGTTLDLQAATLTNQSTINAQQTMTVTGTDLNNNGGTLATNGRLTLNLLGTLNNSGGSIASSGPLLLQRAMQVNNDAKGKIISQSLLTLFTGGLNNSGSGTLAGKDRVAITSTGIVQNNTDGLIYSPDADVQLTAVGLNNANGKVQGQTGLGLSISGDLNNQGGTLQAHSLNLNANRLDNQSGFIAAQTGDAVVNANYFANANGGVYATGLMRVSGVQLDNSAGQIAGRAVELSAGGALINRSGVIESDNTLSVTGGSVDNQGGQLRALGRSGKTNFQLGGAFDNRNGRLETSNADLTLNTGGFLNQGGSLLHGGTGTFDIATANLINAGGNLVTRGGLTLAADSWTNSSVIQAGRLTVNVNTLNQTASGQLLASDSLTGNGGNWNNDGLIASDGTANLTLAGSYGGNGRYSSLGNLGLTAAQITVNETASVAGGGASQLTTGGQLLNRGRLTSSGELRINAGSVVNTGTLGASQNLVLTAQSLLNDHAASGVGARGFLFSGQDSTFNLGSLTNNYSDIYSLGNLTVAGVAGGTQAQSVRNVSASIESMGDLRLAANDVVNEREKFKLNQQLTSVGVGIRCTQHCSGGWSDRRPAVTLSRTVSSVLEIDSPSATLSAGRNMVVTGQNFTNRYSVVSAANDLSITGENILNQAATGGSGSQSQEYSGITKISKGQYNQMVAAVQAYNRAHPQGSPVDEAAFAALMTRFSPSLFPGINQPIAVQGGTQVVAPAIIQAGGNAALTASKSINNINVIKTALAVGGRSLDTGVGANNTQVVVLNAQLPPDLAQQQVNPLTLPGFGLPSGQNGLFRLSGQSGTTGQAGAGNQDWTLGSASLDASQRQQALPETHGRVIQVGGAAQVTTNTRQVAVAAREAGLLNAVASAIDTGGVGSADVQTRLPGRTNGADITRVDGIDAHNPAGASQPAVDGSRPGIDLPAVTPGDRVVHTSSDGTLPDLSVPGLSTVARSTDVAAIAPPDTQLPALTPAAQDVLAGGNVRQPAVSQPTALAGQTISRVQGVPENRAVSQPHKYLIETNPVLTDLKQFMSSDYLLQGLGYNPDESWKRLGDGLYEQRLVQQAVQARTGQRFIDGQTSDEKLFKYLMDNAISSKQQLNLSMGVSLTSQQVAALTHDIVWLEEHEVNGEKVLVPVLYLAQANNRLAPTGALIAGNDLNLIAGENLVNAGTLRATNNLSAKAANDVTNSGLIEAGNRLDLLAGNNIVNKAGGIIKGRDVTLTAINGDVINERSVTGWDDKGAGYSQHRDYVDSAARVEAANDLSIKAGQDFSNQGAVLQSGRDTTIQAGRDLSFGSAEQVTGYTGGRISNSTVTQHGSSVTVGRDLTAVAGRDLTAIASQIEAKRDVAMSATGDLSLISAADEQHSAYNSKKLKTQEDHVSQVSTTVKAGRDVSLSAGQDLAVTASRVSAGDEAYLFAGNDLTLNTAEDSDYSYYSKTKKGSWGKKSTKMSESESDVAISSSIEAGKKVVISAAQDINLEGAKINSGGELLASAGHDINLEAAQNYSSQASASSKKGMFSSKSRSQSSSQTTLNSTELVAESIKLQADNDISLEAAALRAEGAIKLNAGNDVEIGTAQVQQTSSQSKQSSKVGLSLTVGMSATQKGQQAQQSASQSIGSDISADSLQITSGRDTAVRGSTLVTDHDLRINTGRNLEVVSAENSESASSKANSKKVGEVGSWWQSATGIVKTKKTDQSETTRQTGSQIASLGGGVGLSAGEQYTQIASQVVAPKGDIDIKAKHVDIVAGFDTLKASNTASTSRTAIGGTVSVPMVDALRSLQGTAESAQQTSDGRMLALSAVNAAMSANAAIEGGQALMNKNLTGVKISVNLSDSRSHSESDQSGRNVVGSSVVAGGDVSITAKGAGADSNLNVVGSRIDAGGDANLKADGKINLLAAQNTAHQESTNNNSGWSAGIGFSFGGQQNGFTLDLAANKGRGMSDGDDVTQTNTSVKAGQTVRLDSAGDTNLKGAVVTGQQVQAKVGGDLNIESLQDTSTYRSEQLSANVGVSICIPPFCMGMSSVSGGIGQQKMHSDYASVSDQSGIKARDGGFQIEVKGNTDLKGAIIASTDKAVADGKNTLSTSTLTSSDIKNKADYDATSINLSGGYSAGGKVGRDANGNVDATKAGTPVADKGGFGVNAPVALYAGDSSSSKTLSGISGAAVTVTDSAKQQALTGQTAEQAVAAINTDVSSDRDGSNRLKPIFDAKEIQVGFEITGKFVQNVAAYLETRAREADALRSDAEKEFAKSHDPEVDPNVQAVHRQKYLDLNKQANAIAADWGAGGTYRQIASALVAGASGNVTGGGAQFAQNMVVNYVQQQGSDYIGKLVINGMKEGSPEHASLHAILGCAGAAASSQSCSAGALGGSASSLLAGLFNETSPNETSEEREAKRNIIASMVTGIAAMSNPNGAATATNAAIANVDNNWLATQQIVQMVKEVAEAETFAEKMKVTGKWLSISGSQDMTSASALFNSFKDSMAGAGIDTLNGAVGVLRDPVASIDAMNAFILSVEGEKLFGAAAAGFKSQISQLRDALVAGGDENAEKLGKQMGEAVALYAQVIATGGTVGAAQGASTLSKAGVEVSINGFKEIAAATKAAGGVEGKLAKFERVVPEPNAPRPIDAPNHVPVGGPQYVKSATIQANTTVELSESVTLKNGKVIPKGSVVTVSDDTMKVVYADGTSELASYSKVSTAPLGLPNASQIEKAATQARQDLLDEINKLSSKTQATKQATMVGAYDPVTGKTAIGSSNGAIAADMLHPNTVKYIEDKLGVKIGEFTDFCKNKAGACAEVSAADSLVRQGVDPSGIKFTDAVRPRDVWGKNRIPDTAIIPTCTNCSVTWPRGDL
jgi:filamentous hemagglutinin